MRLYVTALIALIMSIGARASAEQAAQSYILNGPAPGTIVGPSNPLSVITKPGGTTQVPLDIATVATGGTAVNALFAGHATEGGLLITANAAGMCVNQIGTAGTTTSGNTICVPANVSYGLLPSPNAVSVNSTGSNVALAGNGLQ